MKLIIGLGNPGVRYQKTRHNVGHWTVDALRRLNVGQAKLYKTNIFMNESGREVKKIVGAGRLSPAALLIAHDDLDLLPGQWKLQFNRSSAGHKGVQSVIEELGTQKFWRLRIGIGKTPAGKTTDEFVVEKPTTEERKLIERAIEEVIPRIKAWVGGK